MNPMISIIVPVYNAEKYLEECLESIRNQTFTNYEVIMVNDGSTDSSEAICRRYSESDNRFLLISQDNSGVCKTRNIGMKKMRGKYTSFVDADDKIDADFLSSLFSTMIETNSDIVMCDFYNEEGPESKDQSFQILEADSIWNAFLRSKIYNRVMNKLYKREVIDAIAFPEDRMVLEDAYWTAKVLENVQKITIIPEAKYYYRIVAGSLSHKRLNAVEKASMYRNKLERYLVLANNCSDENDKAYLAENILNYFDVIVISSNDLSELGVYDCMKKIIGSRIMRDVSDKRCSIIVDTGDPRKIQNKYLCYLFFSSKTIIKYRLFSLYRLIRRGYLGHK